MKPAVSTKTGAIQWENVRVKLGDLKPWDKNPRTSTKAQARRILESFEKFGQVETLAIGPDLAVYDGHQRLSALLALHGAEYEIDARQASRALSPAEQKKLVIALHAGATGSWDWDKLDGWNLGDLMGKDLGAALLKSVRRDARGLDMFARHVKRPEPKHHACPKCGLVHVIKK